MLLNQITEIISKNINAIEADVITKELSRLQQIEIAYTTLTANHKTVLENLNHIQDKYAELRKRESYNIELEQTLKSDREDLKIKLAALGHESDIIKLREKFAEIRVQDHKEMMKTVFKNNYVAKTIMHNSNDYDSNTGRTTNHHEQSTETYYETE